MQINSHGASFLYGALSSDCVTKLLANLPPYRDRADEFADATLQTRLSYSAAVEDTSENAWLYEFIESAFRTFNEQTNFNISKVERPMQVIRYPIGGSVGWHVDGGAPTQGLVRKLSISVQLSDSDSYNGGDLEFAAQPTQPFARIRGTIACFPSYCVHQVSPVTKGERLSLVCFALGPPFA